MRSSTSPLLLLAFLSLPASLVACSDSDADPEPPPTETPLDAGTDDDASTDADTDPTDSGTTDAGEDADVTDGGDDDAATDDGGLADGGDDDAGDTDGGLEDGGDDAGPDDDGRATDAGDDDAGLDDGGTTDPGDEDAGVDDGGATDAGDDGGLPSSGWQPESAVIAGTKPLRTTMVTTPEGDVLLAFRDTFANQDLRVVRWHGEDSGAWEDLGIANDGVAGELQTGADPQGRFVGLALAGEHAVVAYRQNGAVYANVHDGDGWGEPVLLSDVPSAVAVAGDRTKRALVVHRDANDRVSARLYDATTKTWGDDEVISPNDYKVDAADSFWVEATMTASGDALVVYRGYLEGQTQTRNVVTSHYSAADDAWTPEYVSGVLQGSTNPEHLCLASNDAGAAVVSLREQFTNQVGTFTRTRAAYRAPGDSSWGAWQTLSGTTFFDSCAISADGTAIVLSNVSSAVGHDVTPHRHDGSAWSTGSVIVSKSTSSASRVMLTMGSEGDAAATYFRGDNEVRFFRYAAGDAWTESDAFARTNPINTFLDQYFKGSLLLDDGRFLWVYQDNSGYLWFSVYR